MRRVLAPAAAAWLAAFGVAAAQTPAAESTPPEAAQPASDADKPAPSSGSTFIPVEITEAAPTNMSGPLRRGTVVAQHQLRAIDAVVLDERIAVDGRREIPAGTALALGVVQPTDEERRGLEEAPAERRIWCDVRPTGNFTFGSVDCFRDSDGDGRLDRVSTGTPGQFRYSYDVVSIDEPVAMTPVRVHPAATAERPTTRIGYSYCEGDGVTAPPRFGTAVLLDEGDNWYTGPMTGLCPFGVWSDPSDHGTVQVDRVQVRVQGAGDALTYVVEGRIPAGRIARPSVGEPILAAADAPTLEDRVRRLVEEMIQPPLRQAGTPQLAALGRVARGETILSVPVRYGMTGVLQNEVTSSGLFSTTRLPVGRPVYGIPMMGPAGPDVIWCAPELQRRRDGTRHWEATCLPRDGGGSTHMVDALSPLLATHLYYQQTERFASDPSVERREIDVLGTPLTLSYRFVELDDDDADIDVVLTASGIETVIGQVHPSRKDGGEVEFETLGGAIRITRAPDDRRVGLLELVRPFTPEGRPAL